jgi:hypothetical protein
MKLVNLSEKLKKQQHPLMRSIYFTAQPLGEAGSVGSVQQGDLTADKTSKLVYFDTQTQEYHVQRRESPLEKVPMDEIIPVLRSLVRQGGYLTLAETNTTTGEETLLEVLSSTDIPLAGHQSGGGGSGEEGKGNSTMVWIVVAVVILAAGGYYVYKHHIKGKKGTPASLPVVRPIVLGK